MKPRFDVVFLGQAWNFLDSIEDKVREKILYNIDKAKYVNDPKLFKKISQDIWEFRTNHSGASYRLLAFWDKINDIRTLVVTTSGFIKKTEKLPIRELEKAIAIMNKYFEQKSKN